MNHRHSSVLVYLPAQIPHQDDLDLALCGSSLNTIRLGTKVSAISLLKVIHQNYVAGKYPTNLRKHLNKHHPVQYASLLQLEKEQELLKLHEGRNMK